MTDLQTFDYARAVRAIWDRSLYDRGFISNPFAGDDVARLGLHRTEAVLDRLGRPQERYGIVHVAGSKGKGSTCAFAAEILRAAGHRVGRYTSPHLHAFRERIAVDADPIAESTFAALTAEALAAAADVERAQPDLGQVTAFELVTAMALHHFAQSGCDLAVVEVGLGGSLDATNVVMPLVAVITALDYEHTRVLGTTLTEIAANKAGIVKPGRPVVVSPQVPEALAAIGVAAARQGSRVYLGGRDWQWRGGWSSFAVDGPWGCYDDLRSGLVGAHQIENAATAIAATWLLGDAGITIDHTAVRQGLAATRWVGRYEIVDGVGPRIVLDGAHTPASARVLAETVQAEEGGRRAVVLLGLLADKDPAAIARALLPVAAEFVVSALASPRAANARDVSAQIAPLGAPVAQAPDVRAALALAATRAGPGGLVVVAGSLTTVAEAREALGLGQGDPLVAGA